MRNHFHRYLIFCATLSMAGCGDVNEPTIAFPQIYTTAISGTSVTLAWNQAADTRSDTSALVYKIYQSSANPAYQGFDSFGEVEAGTLVDTLTGATTITISTGIAAGSTYYFNIVVLDEEGNKALYEPLGEYFHAGQVSYYPFNGNGNNAALATNPLRAITVYTGFALPTVTSDRFSYAGSAYSYASASLQCWESTLLVGISGNDSRSVSFWVQPSSTGTARAPFAWGDGTADGSSFGFFETGVGTNWIVWLSGAANVPTLTAATSSWEHWVIGYNSATDLVYTYKNGVVVNNGDTEGVAANTVDTRLYVGCGQDAGVLSYAYQGNIDDVRIFNQLLSAADVANLYAVTRP